MSFQHSSFFLKHPNFQWKVASSSVCFPQLLVTACPVLYIKQVGGCVYMNLLHFLYSSLKHLRHRQKQAIGWYRSCVWFIPAVVGIFVCLFLPLVLLFVCFYPLTTAYESVFCFHVVLIQMWMKYCSVILFFVQLRAVQNWFCCVFFGFPEWVGKYWGW